jgi:hypothetical protein
MAATLKSAAEGVVTDGCGTITVPLGKTAYVGSQKKLRD